MLELGLRMYGRTRGPSVDAINKRVAYTQKIVDDLKSLK